jgi:hypothetical protein
MSRLEELLLLWQDQTISPEEVAELKRLLVAPEARVKVAADFFLTGALLESLRVQKAAADTIVAFEPTPQAPLLSTSHRKRTFAYSLIAMAVAIVLICGAWYWFHAPEPNPISAPAFAQVEGVQGEFFVINNQQMRPAQTGEILVPGQGIATEGESSGAVVQMKDAVRLKLGGNTTVFTTNEADQPGNEGARLVLEKGDLLIDVTRSLKRKKTSVQTGLGLAVAESDEVALHVSDAAGVVVVRGEVRFQHKATGESIRLREGQYLAITGAGELYASQLFSANAHTWTTFPRIGLDTATLSYAVAFAPDSKQLAAVNRPGEGGVRVGQAHGPMPPRELKGDTCVRFSLDGKWLATADVANIRLYDLAEDSKVRILATKERKRRVQCLAFSPDGQFLAVGRAAVKNIAEVEIWDIKTGVLRHTWRQHSAHVTCLAFSVDGKVLASGSLDRTVFLWDTETLAERARVVVNPAQPVWSLAFSPRGDTLAIATGPEDFRVRQPGEVALYSVVDGKIRLRLHGHSRAVTSAAFSKDAQTLITGSADTTVRFWDLKTGREYGMLKGHKAAPGFEALMVALSPDGTTLATASFDQTVKLWSTRQWPMAVAQN